MGLFEILKARQARRPMFFPARKQWLDFLQAQPVQPVVVCRPPTLGESASEHRP